jgi:transcriptional regulator with XRE-family HTH domain
MTLNDHSESKRNVYDACDPTYLRQLREAAGMDLAVLARTACLSIAQVRQLETDDSDNFFYSESIKRQAYKRLLMILGAEPPMVEVPDELRDPARVAQAHLDTLDQIVAMSHQPTMNRTTKDVIREGLDVVQAHKQMIGALLLLLISVVLFVLSQHKPASDTNESMVKPVATVRTMPPVSASSASVPVVVPEPVTPVPASVVAPSPLKGCAYSSEVMPQLTSLFAKKETHYVYLVGTTDTEVCVVDANKQATLVQLKAGESRSVYGAAPWQISGAQLQKIQIYFQGSRVSVPDREIRQFKLDEIALRR